ncbi:MAG: hypothetical protein Q7T73_09840 [Beijerinckiaceae bacterium]|nr:hypothetical protein [Beijerinckiaceae bacterium]
MADEANVDIVVEDLFDSLLAGPPHPSQQALIEQAGKINNWRVMIWDGPPQSMGFFGEIEGDPRFPDGKEIATSNVVWVDHKLRWIRTRNSFYRLGPPHCPDDDDGDGPGS